MKGWSRIVGKQAIQQDPLVSIVIPTYNYGNFVSEAVDSALAQTYNNIEVIVVDDGSTDNTKDVLVKYNESIRYIHKENAGLPAARNTGIEQAKGEYIAFLDSDDQWLADKVELQMEIFKSNDQVGLVSCAGYHVNDLGQMIDKTEYTDFDNEKRFLNTLITKKYCKWWISCKQIILVSMPC